LYEAQSIPGVERVTGIQIAPGNWRNPFTGRKRIILTMGVNPADQVFTVPELQQKIPLLTDPTFVLIDRKSRREFGPRDQHRFGDADLGSEAEVQRRQVRIVGHFSLGAGFESDGAILLDERGFLRAHPGRTAQEVSIGLVKLHDNQAVEPVLAELRKALPPDVLVLSRSGVLDFEYNLWVREMPVGIIFQLGVMVGLLVGVTIVYQVLSSDVANHLPEYATLKAIGYNNGFLRRVVLQQATALALLGFLPGVIIALVLYRITAEFTNLPIGMGLWRMPFVLGLTLLMCTASGLGAVRKVRQAQPADLF
jgi:putative ABC transport system permease protein